MTPVRHPSNTRTLGAPAGWDQSGLPVEPLGITDQVLEGVPCVWSFWRPDAEELAALNAGGHLVLSIVGRNMPPAAVMVATPETQARPSAADSMAAPSEPPSLTREHRHLIRCAIALLTRGGLIQVAGQSRSMVAHQLQVMLAASWPDEQAAPTEPVHDWPACALFRGGKCTCDAKDEAVPRTGPVLTMTDAAADAFNNTFHKCRAEVSMDWWQRIWAKAVTWTESRSMGADRPTDAPELESLETSERDAR